MSETTICEHCGAHNNAFYHTLTKGLVETLVIFKRAVLDKGNSIHVAKDIELTYSQRANFSKLRVHALVAKDDQRGAGYWLLTHRGSEFLKGNIRVPARVKTINNRVVGHDEELVSIRDVYGSTPYFEQEFETERQPIETKQVGFALDVATVRPTSGLSYGDAR